MGSIGGRIENLRRQRGWTQEELADRSGISRPQISKIEGDRVPNTRSGTLAAIAAALRVSMDELLGGETIRDGGGVVFGAEGTPPAAGDALAGRPVSDAALPFDVIDFGAGMKEVPLHAEVACGEPMDYTVRGESVLIPEAFAPDTERGEYLVRARGDSMVEFGIDDGDYVVIEARPGGVAATGEIIIAWYEPANAGPGGITIKRWFRRGGRKVLQAGNPDSPSYELKDGDNFELVGIVRRSFKLRHHPKLSG